MTLASSCPAVRSAMARSASSGITASVAGSYQLPDGPSGSLIRWVPVSVRPAVASWSALPVAFSQASTSLRENVGLVGLPPVGSGNSG